MKTKRAVACILAIILALSLAIAWAEKSQQDTYTKTVNGMQGPMTIELTMDGDTIKSLVVTDNVETPGIGTFAAEVIPERVVAQQTLKVDVITGATITSRILLGAVEGMLKDAGADVAKFTAMPEKKPVEDQELTADVVIVGGGGAGLVAAVAALDKGASVILIEKTGFLGGNSLVSGGYYNSPDPASQDNSSNKSDLAPLIEAAINEEPVSDEHKELIELVRAEYEEFKKTDKVVYDSPNWFALQSWNGGDKVAELKILRKMADGALDGLNWLKGMGMQFDVGNFQAPGSLYPRAHQAVRPNGAGFIETFVGHLKNANNYTQLMDTTGKSLIMKDGRVVGAIAETKDGATITLNATKGVILATGGFAGNVELRQKYCEGEKWPNLGPSVPTSNVPGNTGDGIFMAMEVGAELVNMEQIQLLHLCNPKTGATYDITSASMPGIFVNKEGKRFIREDGRRDEISKSIIGQTDGMMYLVFSADFAPDASKSETFGGQSLQYYLDNKLSGYVKGETLDDLAAQIGVPADELKKTVDEYNAAVAGTAKDAIGRVSFGAPLLTGPYYAYPRSPACHHTMGGVRVDPESHALDKDGNPIPGLYCAGEITGNLHGGNRLGGNAITDFTVFGKNAGENAAAGK